MSKVLSILLYLKRSRNAPKTLLNHVCPSVNYARNRNENKELFICPFVNYSKDATSSSTNDDYLLVNLKSVNSTQTVLDIVSKHHNIMNQNHVLQAIKMLFALQKKGNSQLKKEDILSNPNFEKLCHSLKSQIRKIELADAIEVLKFLSYVGVPSNTAIMQSVLQMLRHYINDLSLKQIIFLDYLLQQIKPTPLGDALSIALPIVFEAQMPFKIDYDNISLLINCLQYISRKPVSEKCVKQIVDALLDCFENNFVVSGQQAKSILWSVCDMKSDELFEPLITRAVPFFIRDMSSMDYDDVECTLHKLLLQYSSQFPFYYFPKLCDAVVNYIIENNIEFQEAIYCLRKFNKIGYVNNKLLDYISEKCIENPNFILNGKWNNVFILCVGLASTDYRPAHWEHLKDYISNTESFKNVSQKGILSIKLCASLCVLDIFQLDLLEYALSTDYLQSLLTKGFQTDMENMLLIVQTIATFKNDLWHILPNKGLIDEFANKLRPPPDYPLEAPFQKALGGDTYVATNMRTELGHYIDHVVVMRKGGYPVAFNQKEKLVENLEMSPESQTVLILALRPWHYTLNDMRMRGSTSLTIRTLEARGHAVVPICLAEWKSLADFEKIPYLMQAIKLKVDDFRKFSTVGY